MSSHVLEVEEASVDVSIFENMSTWQIVSPIFNAKNRSLDHSNRNQCNRNMVFQHKKRRSVSVVPKNENWTAIFPEIHDPMVFFQSFREFLVVFFDLEEVDGHLWGWHLRIWLAEWEHLGSATATRPSSVRRPKILMPQLICVGNGWKFWEVMVTNYVSTDFIDLVVANTVFM